MTDFEWWKQFPNLIPTRWLPEILPSAQSRDRSQKKLSLRTIYRWIYGGKLHAVKIGGTWYVTLEELMRFLNGTQHTHDLSPRGSIAAAEAGQALERLMRRRNGAVDSGIGAGRVHPGRARASGA